MGKTLHSILCVICLMAVVTTTVQRCGRPDNQGLTYYVDADGGDDGNDGLSAKRPFRSLDKVNGLQLKPGDCIRLKSGSKWIGQLRPQGSGLENAPIRLTRYGKGDLPVIDQDTLSGAVLQLRNQDCWEISEIELNGGTAKPTEVVAGIAVEATTVGRVLKHIIIKDCIIRNTLGTVKKYESAAIWVGVPGWNDDYGLTTGYDGLLIENNRIYGSDRCGIIVWTTAGPGKTSEFQPGLIPSRNVIVRNNYMEDIGGDAILVLGSDAPLIERNTVKRCCLKTGDPAYGDGYNVCSAAIWLHHCEKGIMQYNAVYDCVKQPDNNDGLAYDFDYNCNECILQYNYSENNAGGFLLIMGPATNNVVRYNVSRNDKDHVLHCAGSKDSGNLLYNNTFFIDNGASSYIVAHATFINNIFYAAGESSIRVEDKRQGDFFHNCYGGNWSGEIPDDENAVTADPMIDPESLRPGKTSPCLKEGKIIPDNGGKDFFGKKVPPDTNPDIGAVQR